MNHPSPDFHAAIVHHMRVGGYDPYNSADAYVDHMWALSEPVDVIADRAEQEHLRSLGLLDERTVDITEHDAAILRQEEARGAL